MHIPAMDAFNSIARHVTAAGALGLIANTLSPHRVHTALTAATCPSVLAPSRPFDAESES